MTLSIIIVSFNTKEILRACLSSVYYALEQSIYKQNIEVIVVDNASSDGSADMVRKEYADCICITNDTNVGFAKANNQGIKTAKGEYVLLLNSDTEVEKDTIDVLISFVKKNNNCAVLGCMLLNEDKSLQQSFGYFPNLLQVAYWMFFIDDIPYVRSWLRSYHETDASKYKNNKEVDWVSGACILVKRAVAQEVGHLDERIFMYGEEVEWCYRIKKKGYKVWYTPNTRIIHKKGGSAKGKVSGIYEEFESINYFYQKHKQRWQQKVVNSILYFGALLRLILFGIILRDERKKDLYAKALKMGR